jgi:membrane protein YqaA with SNARE-associated domain
MVDLAGLSIQFSEWASQLAQDWGYLGVFVVSIVGNASIIFPVPSYLVVFALGSVLNPWILGVVAGAGAALGELTGYLLGLGGKQLIESKDRKLVPKAKKWIEKHGIFPILVLFAATPLPDDVVGILGGVIRYNLKKFLLATFIGKVIAHLALAWAGFYGSYLLGGYSGLFSLVIAFIFSIAVLNFVLGEKGIKFRKTK